MTGKLKIVLLVLAFAVVFAATAVGADTNKKIRKEAYVGEEGEPHSHFSDQWEWMDKFHNPADWIYLGLDFRGRYVYAPHIDTLGEGSRSEKWHYTRWRTRLWGKFSLTENVDFNARLLNEWRTWDDPDRKPSSWNGDEIFFDRFNFEVRNFMDMPWKMVIGRQDIILGHGWLVLEGTQNDGSRTIFFDAIRNTIELEDMDTTLDLIYINNVASLDKRIHPINDRDNEVSYTDSEGFIAYASNRSLVDNAKVDGYFIYKKDDEVYLDLDGAGTDAARNALSKDSEIYTFGGLIEGDFDDEKVWHYYFESALQFGNKRNTAGEYRTQQGYGMNSKVTYNFQDEWQNTFSLCYENLSGDDPDSSTNEQFDPLWGEWPQWSELLIYTYSRETTIAEVTNLQRLGFSHTCKPADRWTIATSYHLLWANEASRGNTQGANFGFSGDGDLFRGQLLTNWIKYKCCDRFNAHIVTEYFMPGNYYAKTNRDDALFFRLNFEYTF